MIDARDLRERPDVYRLAAKQKRIHVDIDRLLEVMKNLRHLETQRDQLVAEQGQNGKQIGQIAGKLKKAEGEELAKLTAEMDRLKQRPTEIKQLVQNLEAEISQIEPEFISLLLRAAQPCDSETPIGEDDSGNVELRTWGTIRKFDFEPKDHITLGSELGMVDFERGAKLAGSRSYVLTGWGCMLHQAVLRFSLDLMIKKGFTPMSVPVLVREPAMLGTGYFPLGREQAYALTNEEPAMYLVGTSEVPLTAFHMDEILDEASLPKKYVAMSNCFRREAGTYGKDATGLYRIHQFDKIEQVIVCKNDVEESKKWHQEILGNAEEVLQALDLPYRVVQVCSGDLGQGQAAKYDIETWMPSRKNWGETHSASRFYDFQARRLNLRYRGADKETKTKFCHTLNNTVVASPRILIPIMELWQNADGSITVPPVLRPYMSGIERIEKTK